MATNIDARNNRKERIRKKVSGTSERPRLTVYKSIKVEAAAAAKAAADKAAADKVAADKVAADQAAAAKAAADQEAANAAAKAAPVAPAAPAAPAAPVQSGCDPNYAGACVPVDSDVDCAGGKGNGPSYVRGPVTVIGSDIYGLDNDHDGIGCEK